LGFCNGRTRAKTLFRGIGKICARKFRQRKSAQNYGKTFFVAVNFKKFLAEKNTAKDLAEIIKNLVAGEITEISFFPVAKKFEKIIFKGKKILEKIKIKNLPDENFHAEIFYEIFGEKIDFENSAKIDFTNFEKNLAKENFMKLLELIEKIKK